MADMAVIWRINKASPILHIAILVTAVTKCLLALPVGHKRQRLKIRIKKFNLISNFKEALLSRPYIFAIGYSFFDPYINNLIIKALNNNAFSKLIIVNPKFGPNVEKDKITVDKSDLTGLLQLMV